MWKIGLCYVINLSIAESICYFESSVSLFYYYLDDHFMNKIFYIFIGLFLLGAAFLFGMSVVYKNEISMIERVERAVLGYLDNPKAESFKNVTYYFDKISHNGGEVGYVCGFVSRHYDFSRETEDKRFIVKTYIRPDGTVHISIPIIDGVDEMLTEEQIDNLWNKFCKGPSTDLPA